VLALASCRGACDIPDRGQECFGESLVDDGVPDGGRNDCIACIENTPCCDAVGRCKDDLQCAVSVRGVHHCVLERGGPRGAANEQSCLGPLDIGREDAGPRAPDTPARALYNCMRTHCGPQCGLPVCRLEPDAPFGATPRCDRCFSFGCCEEFNACADNRLCRLALGCIVGKCAHELAFALDRSQAVETSAQEKFFCGETTENPFDGVDSGPPADSCINECVRTFLGDFADPLTPELSTARCLALRVQSCGARNDCGRECVLEAGAPIADAGGDSD
jgi:hypothetical protein